MVDLTLEFYLWQLSDLLVKNYVSFVLKKKDSGAEGTIVQLREAKNLRSENCFW